MINPNNLSDVLPMLIKDDNIFEAFKTNFPEILADLVTFKSNPNCSCKGRVIKFFSDKLEQDPNILNSYVVDPVAINRGLQDAHQQRIMNNYSGRVFEIGKTEQDWLVFSQSLIGKMFRGFTVVERADTVAVYFL
jgi:hypothetical protein